MSDWHRSAKDKLNRKVKTTFPVRIGASEDRQIRLPEMSLA
jgi:hypothetical protein